MKKKYLITIPILVLLAIIALLLSNQNALPYDYLKKHSGDIEVTEMLHQEKLQEDTFLIFFLNGNNTISCAILKKDIFSYKILRISGELSATKESQYLFSSYTYKDNYYWIDWGVFTDDTINNVYADEQLMNIITDIPYGYRICWLVGEGKREEPPKHYK